MTGGLIVAAVWLTLAPLRVAMPTDGLDPSWGLAIERAALEGWQWGRDLVFTFGPYGYHYQRLFHPDLAAEILIVSGTRCLLIGLGVALLVRGARPMHAALAVTATLTSLPVTGDTAYLLLPLLGGLVHFRGRAASAVWYPLAVAAFCGLAALIKTTFAVLALFLALLVDLDRLRERRLPVMVPAWLTTALAAYIAAGQDLAALPDFVRLSLSVAGGFSEAMSMFDALRAIELAAFMAASSAIIALVITIEWRAGRLATGRGALVLLVLAAFWFVTYKAGFTRHDLHTLIAWSSLGVAAALYAASADATSAPRCQRLLLAAALAIALLSPIRLAVTPGFGIADVMLQTLVHNPGGTLREAAGILADPTGWRAAKAQRRTAALADIRALNPLPDLTGTVDTVPSIQAAVIAAGADYRPRPVIQEYSTYTAALIAANRAALVGPGGPDTLLLAPGSIDDRYPSLAEGPLWPEILARYEPETRAGPVTHLNRRIEVLVLRRRAAPLSRTEDPGISLTGTPGEEITVPALAGGVLAEIDLRLSVAGRLLTLLHQAPMAEITVTLADGSSRRHRLVPAIAREGFVLSPYVADAGSLVGLFDPTCCTNPDTRVVSLRIDVPALARWAFAEEMTVSFTGLR